MLIRATVTDSEPSGSVSTLIEAWIMRAFYGGAELPMDKSLQWVINHIFAHQDDASVDMRVIRLSVGQGAEEPGCGDPGLSNRTVRIELCQGWTPISVLEISF
jgi:hypothetical protein